MIYCLYNLKTGEVGEHRPARYMVDGKPGTLPGEVVELEVVETPPLVLERLQSADKSYHADLEKRQLVAEWAIIEPTEEQLAAFSKRPVSKDIVVRRIRQAGMLSAMRLLLSQMTPDQQFEFTQLTELDPTRADLRAGIQALGLDPEEILNPDHAR